MNSKDELKAGFTNFQLISFSVGKEEYGIPILEVQEIVRMPKITHLPQTQEFIKGIINLRGNLIPIIDLRERFKMALENYNEMTRVIVVRTVNKQVGIIVDAVSQVLEVNEADMEEAPDIINGLSKEYIQGIVKFNDSMIIQLDVGKILSTNDEIAVMQSA